MADHVAQRGLAKAAQCLGGQAKRAVRCAFEQALAAQFAFQLGQSRRVDARVVAQLAGQCLQVDVLHAGTGIRLAQLLGQPVELGQVLHGLRAFAHAHGVLAAEPLTRLPVLTGAQRAQVRVQRRDLGRQPWVAERLIDQLGQLGALLGGHRVHHALGSSGTGRQRVDEFVRIAGILGEKRAVLAHELVELLGRVLATSVRGEQVVQVRHHLPDPFDVLGAGVLQGFLHALEPGFHQFLAEKILDFLVLFAALFGAPVVVRQFVHGGGGARWQRVQLGLGEPGVVGRVGEQGAAFGFQRLVQ